MIVDIHAHIGHHPLMDFRQEPDELLAVMDRHGIDAAFVLPFPTMKMRKVNDYVAEAVRRHPDRLIGFANINPMAEDALGEVERAAGLGLKGVMLDPEFHGLFDRTLTSLPRVVEVLIPCLEHGLPVLFNTPNIEVGEGSGRMGFEPYYEGIRQLASRFPEVRLIVNTFWPRLVELMMERPNIIVDTGGRNGISEGLAGSFRLADRVGPTRICFGSESPQNHPFLGIKEINTIKIPPSYRELILGKNARRIFKDLFD